MRPQLKVAFFFNPYRNIPQVTIFFYPTIFLLKALELSNEKLLKSARVQNAKLEKALVELNRLKERKSDE